jgi:methylated-DNA-[protein]-cysteine S-methyltransferase
MRYFVTATPLGPITVASTSKGLAQVGFGNLVPRDGIIDQAANAGIIRQIEEYFRGERTGFDVPLDCSGTAFQLRVWQELMKIPYGETRSYGELARSIGKPGSARAVGRANHENRLALVIPCHRVVGHDGSLTGYAAGLHFKQKLLALEKRQALFT